VVKLAARGPHLAETTYNLAREIIYFVTCYYKLIYCIYSKGFERNRDLSRLLLYVQVPHMLLTLKHYHQM
jgi:hypothetical protein